MNNNYNHPLKFINVKYFVVLVNDYFQKEIFLYSLAMSKSIENMILAMTS